MKNIFTIISIALFISIIVHILTFKTINNTLISNKLNLPTSNKKVEPNKNKGYSNIKFVKIKKSEPKQIAKKISKPKQIVKKPTINNEIKEILKPKKILKKKIVKKVIKQENKTTPLKPLDIKPQVDLKSLFTISKEEQIEKEIIEKQNKEYEKKVEKEIKELKNLDPLTQSYIKLYGNQYFKFSKEQKRYLKSNLSLIGKVTKKYLRYPGISIRTNQSGVNIIEFILDPNGDISNLKLLDSSGFTALDKNTKETIELAYKEYPRPSEPTKIRIYVSYILY